MGGESALERVEIEQSANGGYSVKCYNKQPKGNNGPYMAPKLYTFQNWDAAAEFVGEKFGGSAPDESGEGEEADE